MPDPLERTDEAMIELARKNVQAVGAGHSFIVFLGDGYYPINVLNAIKAVPEVAPFSVRQPTRWKSLSLKLSLGGVSWGGGWQFTPGHRRDEDIAWRKGFLRMIGYKL